MMKKTHTHTMERQTNAITTRACLKKGAVYLDQSRPAAVQKSATFRQSSLHKGGLVGPLLHSFFVFFLFARAAYIL